VREALHRLNDADHIAYIVGGSVRDFLLNQPTKDHDIATSARPEELCRLFPNAVTVGKAFGVIKVPVPESPTLLEIATFRQDLNYKDHRHPSEILFSDPTQDAKRRDFTINALFYDPKTLRILDAVEGMKDLQAKVIRAIGDPHLRFREDALRLLRAVRFATALDFKLEATTATAIESHGRLICVVSFERIRDEINLILTGPRPADALQLLSKLKLLPFILPELEALKGVEQSPVHHPEGDVWTHTLKCMESLVEHQKKRSVTLAWGMLLHDIGKPVAAKRSAGKNFNCHERDGAKIAEAIGNRFRLSRGEIETISALVLDHLKFKDVFQMREATLQRLIRFPYFEELLALHHADSLSSDGNLTFYQFCAALLQELKATPEKKPIKYVSGEDLIQMGLKPGPHFSRILRMIEDLALERRINSKEEALEYVLKNFV
jgi:tRNA nucleotidyltransferase/poly(A) polymerase